MITFNPSLPKELWSFEGEIIPPSFSVKKASAEYASSLSPTVATIVEKIEELSGGGLAYDVKWHMLQAGQTPAIPGWHCDGTPTQDPYIDEYWLICFGQPTTQFYPISFNDTDNFPKVLPKNYSSWGHGVPLKEGKIYHYNKFYFHRAPEAKSDGDRLLIRGWKTRDKYRHNQPFTVGYY